MDTKKLLAEPLVCGVMNSLGARAPLVVVLGELGLIGPRISMVLVLQLEFRLAQQVNAALGWNTQL